MPEDNFKERAYGILYEKYKSILLGIVRKSYGLEYKSRKTGELLKEDRPEYIEYKVELAEDLSKIEDSWVKKGFIRKEDVAVINALEHCLGDEHPFFEDIE